VESLCSIHLIGKTDLGFIGAQNTGIRNVQGEIIALLNAVNVIVLFPQRYGQAWERIPTRRVAWFSSALLSIWENRFLQK
jgi:hypothetical protein